MLRASVGSVGVRERRGREMLGGRGIGDGLSGRIRWEVEGWRSGVDGMEGRIEKGDLRDEE